VERRLDPKRLGDSIDPLHRAAWTLCGSRHDADDLVQETYARVLEKPRMIRRDSDLPYLLRTLRNTFLTQRRRQARMVPVPYEVLAAEVDRRPGIQPDQAAEMAEVFAKLAALSADHRAVIAAVDVAGLSYKEAARALRVPPGTVMSRLHRARDGMARSF
jgi:RNA polymerase sigma-70 factor, ECF subfamily